MPAVEATGPRPNSGTDRILGQASSLLPNSGTGIFSSLHIASLPSLQRKDPAKSVACSARLARLRVAVERLENCRQVGQTLRELKGYSYFLLLRSL